jgi:hypothetical protein
MDQYYGPFKITEQNHLGNGFIEVRLEKREDEPTSRLITITEKMAKYAITDAPVDLTQLRLNRCTPVAASVIETILDWNLKIDEIEYLFALVITSLNTNMDKAANKLWGSTKEERTIKNVEDVIGEKDGTRTS